MLHVVWCFPAISLFLSVLRLIPPAARNLHCLLNTIEEQGRRRGIYYCGLLASRRRGIAEHKAGDRGECMCIKNKSWKISGQPRTMFSVLFYRKKFMKLFRLLLSSLSTAVRPVGSLVSLWLTVLIEFYRARPDDLNSAKYLRNNF